MTTLDLVKPWRLLVSVPPLLYGALLILGLPQSRLWLLLVCGVLLMAVMIVVRLEYPMLAMWPAFVGLFLISASVCALIEDVIDYAFVPFTDSDSEIVLAILVGVAFITWGIQTTKEMTAY
jgi:uncharacterized membrane protein HdeD (DUF308 family)